MSTDIGKNEISNFFISKFHSTKISFADAKKLGINVEKYKDADTNDDNKFDLDEIDEIKELYAAFTAIVEEDKSSTDDAKDAEKEKEEQIKIKDKNGAGMS